MRERVKFITQRGGGGGGGERFITQGGVEGDRVNSCL